MALNVNETRIGKIFLVALPAIASLLTTVLVQFSVQFRALDFYTDAYPAALR